MFRTETKGERKRTTTTLQNSSNSSYLVEEVTPKVLSLGTKPFVIFYFLFYQWVGLYLDQKGMRKSPPLFTKGSMVRFWRPSLAFPLLFFRYFSLLSSIEKFIAKLVNSNINFTRKTDIVLIAS